MHFELQEGTSVVRCSLRGGYYYEAKRRGLLADLRKANKGGDLQAAGSVLLLQSDYSQSAPTGTRRPPMHDVKMEVTRHRR